MSEASTGLIGAAILEPARIIPEALTRGVNAEWFAEPSEAAIWTALERMHRERRAIDMLLLASELRTRKTLDDAGGMQNIERIVDKTPTTAYGGYYLEVLTQEMLSSGIRKVFDGAKEQIREDPVAAIGEITRGLRELQERGAGTLEVDKRPLLEKKLEQWKEVAHQRFELHNPTFCMGTPLPWGCLNSVFSGLRPGLHILGARTSVGKTVYALNVSQFWCERNIPHAFVSLDMEVGELLTRYVAANARVSLRKLEWGARKDELAAAEATIPAIDQSCMHMTPIRSLDRLEGWLHMAQQRWGIKAVVLDYIQLARVKNDRHMRAFERVCEATQQLKDMANTMGLPFLLLAQLSREVDKAERENVYAEPRLSDLGDSSELEKAAASVTLMYRDQTVEAGWRDHAPEHLAYGDAKLAQHLRAIWLKIEKNQQGLAGVRRPFIMYPHQFILRPACYEVREKLVDETVDPVTKKKKRFESWDPAFRQIRDDWRTLPEDDTLAEWGALGNREYHEGE